MNNSLAVNFAKADGTTAAKRQNMLVDHICKEIFRQTFIIFMQSIYLKSLSKLKLVSQNRPQVMFSIV